MVGGLPDQAARQPGSKAGSQLGSSGGMHAVWQAGSFAGRLFGRRSGTQAAGQKGQLDKVGAKQLLRLRHRVRSLHARALMTRRQLAGHSKNLRRAHQAGSTIY